MIYSGFFSAKCKERKKCQPSVANKQQLTPTSGVSEDVFVLKNKDGKNPEIFGLFSTTR